MLSLFITRSFRSLRLKLIKNTGVYTNWEDSYLPLHPCQTWSTHLSANLDNSHLQALSYCTKVQVGSKGIGCDLSLPKPTRCSWRQCKSEAHCHWHSLGGLVDSMWWHRGFLVKAHYKNDTTPEDKTSGCHEQISATLGAVTIQPHSKAPASNCVASRSKYQWIALRGDMPSALPVVHACVHLHRKDLWDKRTPLGRKPAQAMGIAD